MSTSFAASPEAVAPGGRTAPRHVVTAVLVTHDGHRWLPDVLAALDAQTRRPERLVAVDTGSTDGSRELLAARLGEASILSQPAGTGFGAALNAMVSRLGATPAPPGSGPAHERVEWIWVLHDDCAPAPDALARLLETVDLMPSVAVAGPKVLDWSDPRRLLEVGVTMAGSGRRETGLERREQDQGQHDGVHDVLAVGSAGMLVRRDVWDALGGLDPALAMFRDDVDLGWRANRAGHRVVCVTDAVVRHAEAAARGRRRIDAGRVHRPHLLDRRSALHVLLANAPLWAVPLVLVRLLLGTALRAVAFLLAKAPGDALDEVSALLAVLLRPGRLVRARAARRRTSTVPHRAVGRLLAPPSATLRHLGEAVGSLGAARATRIGDDGGRHRPGRAGGPGAAAVETGPASEELDEVAAPTGGLLRVLRRPGVALTLGLVVLALLAERGLGSGRLLGGALLPAPQGASDLWHAYAATWHPVGLGDATTAPPWLAVVALLATLLLGKAPLAVSLLLLGAVPLAGLSAWSALGRLTSSTVLRGWGAVTYALVPAAVGAVAAGRLGTAVVVVLLPLLARGAVATLGLSAPGRRPVGRSGAWSAAWATGLGLAVAAAFVPLTWLLAVPFALAGVLVLRGRERLRPLAALVVAPVVLLPWSLRLLSHPVLLLREPGLPGPGLAEPRLDPLAVLLWHPGGPAATPVILGAGVLAAALAALLRADRRVAVLLAWAGIATGWVAGLLVSRATVPVPATALAAPAWPGVPTALVALGAVAAAVVGAEDLRRRLSGVSFGWRQPLAALLVVTAGAAPLLAGGWWLVGGATGPLHRGDAQPLPAFVAADAATDEAPRALVLRGRGDTLTYALLGATGPRLGDAELAPTAAQSAPLAATVSALATGSEGPLATTGAGRAAGTGSTGTAETPGLAQRLATFAVRYVVLAPPVDPALAEVLDGVPGLTRLSAQGGTTLWRVDQPAGRLRVVDGDSATLLPAADVAGALAGGRVPAGGAGRLAVLADRADDGWRATLDGEPLEPVLVDGWAQGFALPATGGVLAVRHDPAGRPWWLVAQGALALLALVLALPTGRRSDDEAGPEGVDVSRDASGEPAGQPVGAVEEAFEPARAPRQRVGGSPTTGPAGTSTDTPVTPLPSAGPVFVQADVPPPGSTA
ncbi:MAG TPA: glycosyltransferase [Motilibacteraceae bacterium]|nr:glycosyltransferase [Motilibacteraceae bacterium]